MAALQQFGAHHRSRYDIPLIALTGSCGKTMSKDLAAAVLSTRYVVVKTPGNLNNAIGCPLSLLCIDDNTDVAVIELGANHVGEIAALCKLARPTESAITMVAPAHLEGFGTVEQVAEAKAEIVDALPGDGVFYVNADDPRCVRIAERHAGPQVSYGKQGDVVLECCEPVGGGEMRLTVQPVGDLRLPLVCRAHATNVLLAAAIGLNHGVEEFESPLRDALAVSPRFRVLRIGPFEVIDDTYNANPASTAAALQTLGERSGGPRIAVLGEMLELGDAAKVLHEQVGMLAGGVGVTHLFARGPHAAVMSAAARAAGVQQAECIEDHGEIAEAIRALERPGAVVLVKGSRGMAMEHVIEALRRYYP
ncbi:MAG TPA: UDP-N-acetylmuramoyl-tripeptide--D-alanyl-D-alanine ligase [Candidatus Hydrogenedentes bacterium]|nr:UDP-N-acetylmuramoyl-tripeptide--D-alanyl-D-alanine ligase [Candidatus Hydrogenedentota bacterium]